MSVNWELALTWAGRVWFFSTLQGNLGDVEISEDMSPGSQVGFRSVSLTVIFTGVDVPGLVEEGWPFSTAAATLSNDVDGDVVVGRAENAIVAVGQVDGLQGAVVSFTLQGGPWEQRASWPPVSYIVSDQSFGAPDDAALGRAYPMVFGRPGRGDVNGTERFRGSPGIVVQTTGNARLMIALGIVEATQVQVTDDSVGGWTTHTVYYDADSNGVTYAYVELTAGTTPYVAGHAYYVSWGYTADGGLGAKSSGVREVLKEALGKTSVGCDKGRTLSAPGLSLLLDFYVDEIVDPWDWVKANLLPILPISIYSGPRGAFPVVWNYSATPSDVRFKLVLKQNLYRVGPWEEGPTSEIINEVSIEYAIDASDGKYKKTLVLDQTNNPHSLRSFLKYGLASTTVKTDLIWDEGSAWELGSMILQKSSAPIRRAPYAVPLDVKIKAGDVVSITDPDYALTEALCLVESPQNEGSYRSFIARRV